MIPLRHRSPGTLRSDFILRTGLGTPGYQITPRSPWPSELFALFAVGADRGIGAWLESGTYHGQAAEVLARAAPEARVDTIEIDPEIAVVATQRLAPLGARVRVHIGDGCCVLPDLADVAGPSAGVFLDGPKGVDAMLLAHRLLATRSRVLFVAMHDMPQSVRGRAVPARAAMEELASYEPDQWAFWATDDPEYVVWARAMDEGMREAHVTESGRSGWRPFEHFAAGQPTFAMRSYGPTVAFLFRADLR